MARFGPRMARLPVDTCSQQKCLRAGTPVLVEGTYKVPRVGVAERFGGISCWASFLGEFPCMFHSLVTKPVFG